MGRFIDVEKLKKLIENLEPFSCISEEQDGFYNALCRVKDIIDSLQREQPEMDLEKEIEEYFSESDFYTGWNYDDMTEVARYFWDKGYNARMKE